MPISLDEKLKNSAFEYNSIIDDFIGSYKPGLDYMSFPSGLKINEFNQEHYQELFQRLAAAVVDKPIPRFVLTHTNNAALMGLNNYYKDNNKLLFNALEMHLDLDEQDDINKMVLMLQDTLERLSQSGLTQLSLIDDKGVLTQEHIEALLAFVEKNKSAVMINLPRIFQETGTQYQLDKVAAINRRTQNASKLLEKNPKRKHSQKAKVARQPVRQRKRIDLRHAINIDIELQEGIEEDEQMETYDRRINVEQKYDELDVISRYELRKYGFETMVSSNVDSVFNDIAHGRKSTEIIEQAHIILGNIILGNYKDNPDLMVPGMDLVGKDLVFINRELDGISKEAFSKINEYSQYFPDGINIQDLPQGFAMVPDPNDPLMKVLHFDATKKQFGSQDSLAPKLLAKPPRRELSIDLTDDLLGFEPEDSSLKALWDELKNTKPYSRKDNQLFRKYLPDMMALEKNKRSELIKDCCGVDHFNVEKLQSTITDLNAPKQVQQHALLTLFENNEPDLHAGLLNAPLTNVDLNELLIIYDRYGKSGIENILASWQAIYRTLNGLSIDDKLPDNYLEKLNETLPSVIHHVAMFESLVKSNDEVMQAIATIKAYPPEKREWWEKLYQAHRPKDDSIVELVKTFNVFCNAIEQKGLSLFRLGGADNFPGAGNMPTTLGRMRSILNHCHLDDLQSQWEVIAQIDLSPQGALLALTGRFNSDSYLGRCSFVIPEMEVNPPEDVITQYNKGYKYIYGRDGNIQLKSFYRYLASQQYRLPLSFYKSAVEAIDTARKNKQIPAEVANHLYAILLGSTTGENNRSFIQKNQAKDQWNSIFNSIKTFKVAFMSDEPKKAIAGLLYDLQVPPPLPVLEKLVKLLTQANISQLKRMSNSYRKLRQLLEEFGPKVYMGMQFYSPADFEKKYPNGRNLFEEHLAVSELLKEKGVATELIPLISTFKINTENVNDLDKIVTTIKDINEINKDGIFLQRVIQHLQAIQTIDRLDIKSLGNLLTQIKSLVVTESSQKEDEQERAILETIEQNIDPAHFPEDYFKILISDEPTEQLNQKIKRILPNNDLREIFNKIYRQYSTTSENEKGDLISAIENILSRLPVDIEKRRLLIQLTDKRLLAASVTEYNQLLTALETNGSSSFGNFMQAVDEFEKSTKKEIHSLAPKATYYISTALPLLRKQLKHIKQVDVIKLAADLIIAGNDQEVLDTTININSDSMMDKFDGVIKAFSNNPLDRDSIEQTLTLVIQDHPEVETLPGIKVLRKQLDAIKRGEKEQVKIESTSVEKKGFFATLFDKLGFNNNAANDNYEQQEQLKTLEEKHIREANDQVIELYQKTLGYHYVFSKIFKLIDDLVANYPAAQSVLLPIVHDFLKFDSLKDNMPHIKTSFAYIKLLHDELIALGKAEGRDLVISIGEHFGSKGLYNHEQLITILAGGIIQEDGQQIDFKNYKRLNHSAKKQVLTVVSALLNNKKSCSLSDIKKLTDHSFQYGEEYTATLEVLFKTAPFPTISQVNEWIDIARERNSAVIELDEYKYWKKNPVDRELENGFDLNIAKEQCKRMKGITYTDEEIEEINTEILRVKDLETDEILNEIKGINPSDSTKLLALMAELLYRTKGLPRTGEGNNRKLGRSFEINTTQYLAIHAMLKAGGHVTSQIATGEGKSRIMMIAIACQYALGKTVDFVTADVSLATRDYLEYQAFFKALGAKTNLIKANTPPGEYCKKGINFSDSSNLSLFRNKAFSEGYGADVIDDEANRALLLDEADKAYFDAADTRFNYSAEADPDIRDMRWVYELLDEFFTDSEMRDLHDGENSDADKCNEAFEKFARGKGTKDTEARIAQLKSISRNQLEAWQSAALTAQSLIYGEDFTIRPDVTVLTKTGPKTVSQAKLISGGRASENAKYSFGVHQCLHARLNREKKEATKKKEVNESLNRLEERLVNEGITDFYIDSEKQIVYSSTSKSLLDDYKKGELLAVTGTAGSIKERCEAKHAFKKEGQDALMHFIDMPRHHGQKRIDLPFVIAKDEATYYKKIMLAIRNAVRRNQPVLLVCQNDTKSQELYKFLEAKKSLLKNKHDPDALKLKRISADTQLEDEAAYIENTAGQPGTITIATDRLGRGTDIKLHAKAKEHGLRVIATYLPRERNYLQIVGRSGRFGEKGDSQIILDKPSLQKSLGADILPTVLYTATESYLRHQQVRMDNYSQKQRLIKDTVNDFRIKLTRKFFDEFYNKLSKDYKKEDLLVSWQKFSDKTDKEWNDLWPEISGKLTESPVPIKDIKALIFQFQTSIEAQWKELLRSFESIKIPEAQLKSLKEFLDTTDVGEIVLNEEAIVLLQTQLDSNEEQYAPPIASAYDSAYIGRAVIYQNLWDRVKSFFHNIAAAWRGDGPWFPNLQAWRQGHLSFKQLILGGNNAGSATKYTFSNTGQASSSADNITDRSVGQGSHQTHQSSTSRISERLKTSKTNLNKDLPPSTDEQVRQDSKLKQLLSGLLVLKNSASGFMSMVVDKNSIPHVEQSSKIDGTTLQSHDQSYTGKLEAALGEGKVLRSTKRCAAQDGNSLTAIVDTLSTGKVINNTDNMNQMVKEDREILALQQAKQCLERIDYTTTKTPVLIIKSKNSKEAQELHAAILLLSKKMNRPVRIKNFASNGPEKGFFGMTKDTAYIKEHLPNCYSKEMTQDMAKEANALIAAEQNIKSNSVQVALSYKQLVNFDEKGVINEINEENQDENQSNRANHP